MPTATEDKVIEQFLEKAFGVGVTPGQTTADEEQMVKAVVAFVDKMFKRMRYPLGLAIDFALLAQQLSLHDAKAKPFRPDLTREKLFKRYKLVTEKAGRGANTLTLTFKKGEEQHEVGIRRLEESVCELFVRLRRPGYPSAYVYNTGQWQKFEDPLLLPCCQLSEAGRHLLCRSLIEYGLNHLTLNPFLGREKPRVRLFEEILKQYPRSAAGEKAVSFPFEAGVVQDFRGRLAAAGLLIAPEIQGQAAFERLLGAYPVHRFLHLAHAPVAA